MGKDGTDLAMEGVLVDPDALVGVPMNVPDDGPGAELPPLDSYDEAAVPSPREAMRAVDADPAVAALRARWRPAGEWTTARPPAIVAALADDEGPVMASGIVGLLAAPGGVGKTTAALDLAVIAAGCPVAMAGEGDGTLRWCGLFKVRAGRVLYVNGEDHEEAVWRRVWRTVGRVWGGDQKAAARVAERLIVVPMAGVPGMALVTLDQTGRPAASPVAVALADELLRHDDGTGWAWVVLDPLARFAHGEAETDQAVATATIAAAETLTRVPGHPAVLIAHHTRKGSTGDVDDIRGASALVNGVRWAATLNRRGSMGGVELVDFAVVKANDTKRPGGAPLARGDHGQLIIATDKQVEAYERAAAEQRERERPAKPAKNQPKPDPSPGDGKAAVSDTVKAGI